MTSHQGTTYLLHFVQPYQHARHYIGWTAQLDRRLAQHRAGRGSPLIQAAADAGIDFVLVAPPWPGDPTAERRLHRINNSPARQCQVCRRLTADSTTSPEARPPLG